MTHYSKESIVKFKVLVYAHPECDDENVVNFFNTVLNVNMKEKFREQIEDFPLGMVCSL